MATPIPSGTENVGNQLQLKTDTGELYVNYGAKGTEKLVTQPELDETINNIDLSSKVDKAGDTMTGNLTIQSSNNTGDGLYLNGASGQSKEINFTTDGSLRWKIRSNETAESGSMAGSNFNISRYDNSGNLIDNPLDINRNSGTVLIPSLDIRNLSGRNNYFRSSGNTALNILSGNLGVGTETATDKLTVNGNVRANDATQPYHLVTKSQLDTKADISSIAGKADKADIITPRTFSVGGVGDKPSKMITYAFGPTGPADPLSRLFIMGQGHGSDIDADMLDGKHGSAFALSSDVSNKANTDGSNATGTWGINISGSANSATNWGGLSADFSTEGPTLDYVIGWQGGAGARYFSKSKVQSFLEIPPGGETLQSVTDRGGNYTAAKNSDWAATFENTGSTNAHGVYVNIGASSTGVPFRVDKNNSSLFQINNNGNVGIGTTSPTERLSVNGTTLSNRFVTPAGSNSTSQNPLVLGNDEYIAWRNTTDSGEDVGIKTDANNNLQFYVGEPNRIYIRSDNGNVGIGTNNPTEKLQVVGNTRTVGTSSTLVNPNSPLSTVLSSTSYSFDDFNQIAQGSGRIEVIGFADSDSFTTSITSSNIRLATSADLLSITDVSPFNITITSELGSSTLYGGNLTFNGSDANPNSNIKIEPENLTSGITHTLKVPTENGTLATREYAGKMFTYTSTTASWSYTIPHGLSYTPTMVMITPNNVQAISDSDDAPIHQIYAYISGSNIVITNHSVSDFQSGAKWTIWVK